MSDLAEDDYGEESDPDSVWREADDWIYELLVIRYDDCEDTA